MKKIIIVVLSMVVYSNANAVDDVSSSGSALDTTKFSINQSLHNDNYFYLDVNLGAMTPVGGNTGWNGASDINFGYMFTPNLGVEVGLIGGGNWGSATTQFFNYGALDAAAKGVIPLSSMFELYGKAGIAYGSYVSNTYYANNSGGVSINQQANNTVGALVGAGAQINLSQRWSLHIEDDYIAQFNAPDGYFSPNFVMFGAEAKF